tara:strand:+ start:1086 stop:1247 length:162 start_codon:yes stop_codon:yes gene_type:complete
MDRLNNTIAQSIILAKVNTLITIEHDCLKKRMKYEDELDKLKKELKKLEGESK